MWWAAVEGEIFQLKVLRYPKRRTAWDFPDGPVVTDPPADAGDTGSTPDSGRFSMPWGN